MSSSLWRKTQSTGSVLQWITWTLRIERWKLGAPFLCFPDAFLLPPSFMHSVEPTFLIVGSSNVKSVIRPFFLPLCTTSFSFWVGFSNGSREGQPLSDMCLSWCPNSMTLGYVHEIIRDSNIVSVDDPTVIACHVNNSTMNEGSFVTKPTN